MRAEIIKKRSNFFYRRLRAKISNSKFVPKAQIKVELFNIFLLYLPFGQN